MTILNNAMVTCTFSNSDLLRHKTCSCYMIRIMGTLLARQSDQPLLKHLKKTCIYISCYICTTICGNCMYMKLSLRCFYSAPFHKSEHKCFDRSDPLL